MGEEVNRLGLVEAARPRPGSSGLEDRARYAPWLAGSLWQLHFVVDGRSLPERVHGRVIPALYAGCFDTVSVADSAWPQQAARGLRQLTGEVERDPEWDVLDEGRLPLYVCSECGDVYCGAVTVAAAGTSIRSPGTRSCSGNS